MLALSRAAAQLLGGHRTVVSQPSAVSCRCSRPCGLCAECRFGPGAQGGPQPPLPTATDGREPPRAPGGWQRSCLAPTLRWIGKWQAPHGQRPARGHRRACTATAHPRPGAGASHQPRSLARRAAADGVARPQPAASVFEALQTLQCRPAAWRACAASSSARPLWRRRWSAWPSNWPARRARWRQRWSGRRACRWAAMSDSSSCIRRASALAAWGRSAAQVSETLGFTIRSGFGAASKGRDGPDAPRPRQPLPALAPLPSTMVTKKGCVTQASRPYCCAARQIDQLAGPQGLGEMHPG